MADYLSKVVGTNAVGSLDRCTNQSALMATSGVWRTPGEHRITGRGPYIDPFGHLAGHLRFITLHNIVRDGLCAPKARRHIPSACMRLGCVHSRTKARSRTLA